MFLPYVNCLSNSVLQTDVGKNLSSLSTKYLQKDVGVKRVVSNGTRMEKRTVRVSRKHGVPDN